MCVAKVKYKVSTSLRTIAIEGELLLEKMNSPLVKVNSVNSLGHRNYGMNLQVHNYKRTAQLELKLKALTLETPLISAESGSRECISLKPRIHNWSGVLFLIVLRE